MVIRIGKRKLALIGFLIFLIGSYLGNTEKVISFLVFVLFSLGYSEYKRSNKYAKHQFLFTLFIFASYIWTNRVQLNTAIAMIELTAAIEILYSAIFLYNFIQSIEDFNAVMKVLLSSLWFLTIYLVINTPLNVWGTFLLGANLGLNKNGIGMQMAWGSLFCFYYIMEKKQNRMKYLFAFFAFSFIAVLSGSRKALFILILGVTVYLIIYEENRKMIRNIILAIVCLLTIVLIVMNVPVLYELVGERSIRMLKTLFSASTVSISEDKSIWERAFYRNYALSMFKSKPLIGYGLDGFRTQMSIIGYAHVGYSHCNYTELLADYGLVGFLGYYIYKILLLFRFFFQKERNHICTLFMVLLGLGLIMEYGLVSYYDTYLQIIYILAYCVFSKFKGNNELRTLN